jgi:hypothetical protein
MSQFVDQQLEHVKVNNHTLTKEEQVELLRSVLPACQPQEGSPANTFTHSELDDLQRAVGSIQVGLPRGTTSATKNKTNKVDIRNLQTSFHQPFAGSQSMPQSMYEGTSIGRPPQDGCMVEGIGGSDETPSQARDGSTGNGSQKLPDWHGAPCFHKEFHLPRAFREEVRRGNFCQPTNGVCPGFLQCNLVVLPQGPVAFDFLLFCQRNPKACPLVEVCDVGSPHPHALAPGADLRTDLPK